MPCPPSHSAVWESSVQGPGLEYSSLASQFSENCPRGYGAHFKLDVTSAEGEEMSHSAVGMRARLRCGPKRKDTAAGWLRSRRL